MASPRTGRPLVILAGWLGSQPRSLRRYQALYEKLGLDVELRIATPAMVVEASRASPYLPKEDAPVDSIQGLAWEVHESTQARPCWFFHAFSNGGCFVWEQVRKIQLEEARATTNHHPPVGIVFDSAPANYYGNDNLGKALSYCTWSEQASIQWQRFLGGARMHQQRQDRAKEFWNTLRDDSTSANMRQLYLCSHDDQLTPFSDLNELVQHRKQMLGSDRVWLKDWESSPHCTHLLHHPDEYQQTVEAFVDVCLHNDEKIRSKL
jgi:hypothetical protein